MASNDTKRRRPWRPRVNNDQSAEGQEPMYVSDNGELDPFVRTTEPQASIDRSPSFTEQIERIERQSGLSREAPEEAPPDSAAASSEEPGGEKGGEKK